MIESGATTTSPERSEGKSRRSVVTESPDRLLTPTEVAALFRVDPKTVTRWATSGRIRSIRTPGGHHRFRESDVREFLRQDSSDINL
jgi:excisionase family DNA binding protein